MKDQRQDFFELPVMTYAQIVLLNLYLNLIIEYSYVATGIMCISVTRTIILLLIDFAWNVTTTQVFTQVMCITYNLYFMKHFWFKRTFCKRHCCPVGKSSRGSNSVEVIFFIDATFLSSCILLDISLLSLS